jgi:MFS family permease
VATDGLGLVDRFRPLRALRHSGFRVLSASMVPHMLAMQMSTVALGYLAYELSGNATTLGLIGLGWGIPMLVLSLAGGVVADRFPRRAILLTTQATVGVSAVLGAVLLLTGVIQVWHIFVIALMQGTAFAFNMPARQALIADIVGSADLPSAIALSNSIMNFTRVVGPPVAGVLIGVPTVGINGVYVLMAALYVIVLLTLARLPRTSAPGRTRRSGWRDLVDGLRFIAGTPALVGLLALAFAPMFLGMPHQMLLPVFALGLLKAGPEGLGLLNMASGLGALGGSVGVSFLTGGRGQRLAQIGLGLAFGAGLVGFALSTQLIVAALLLAVVGAASAGYMSLNNALIMQVTPREFYGRVMSVYMMTFALMPLASLPAARLADLIGASTTVAGMGVLLVAAIALVTLWQQRAGPAPAPAATSAPGD